MVTIETFLNLELPCISKPRITSMLKPEQLG